MYVCRYCILDRGMEGVEEANRARTVEELAAHIEAAHHVPLVREGETAPAAVERFLAANPEARGCEDCRRKGKSWATGEHVPTTKVVPYVSLPGAEGCERCRKYTTHPGGLDGLKTYEYRPAEVYREHDRMLYFDVAKAFEIAWARPLDHLGYTTPGQLAPQVKGAEDAHAAHVPLDKVGMVVSIRNTRRDTGESELVHVLIDGKHRARRCMLEGRDFHFFLLDEEETAHTFLSEEEYNTPIHTFTVGDEDGDEPLLALRRRHDGKIEHKRRGDAYWTVLTKEEFLHYVGQANFVTAWLFRMMGLEQLRSRGGPPERRGSANTINAPR